MNNKKMFKMPHNELGKPLKKFYETFSAVTLLKEKYFPDEIRKEKANKADKV
jgi:hypothetical protein